LVVEAARAKPCPLDAIVKVQAYGIVPDPE
jgi:hypothetical protein